MVRWRCCVVLAMLLLLPVRSGSKAEDDDEEDHKEEENDDDEDDEEDDDDDELADKSDHITKKTPMAMSTPKIRIVTRTTSNTPLECYVCAFKIETSSRACLDPTKFRVHTVTCHSPEDKCFTSVISKGNTYEAVLRGCRPSCVGSPETMCCEMNRCNNQALTLPIVVPQTLTPRSKANKLANIPPSVMFFVTILLLLQTVVKVAVV